VRLIGPANEQLGVVPLAEAMRTAHQAGLDLVEVAPLATPPVCRIMDYSKFKYDQTKKAREARKVQKTTKLKGMRFRPKIDDHDIEFKTRRVQEFIEEGAKVKLQVLFRGRERDHMDLGRAVLERVADALKDLAVVERPPLMEGRAMTMILSPLQRKPAAARPPGQAPAKPPAPPPSQPAAGSPTGAKSAP
jgi:translation initiation factor IF-3